MQRLLTAFLILAAFWIPAGAQTQLDPETASAIEVKPMTEAADFMIAAAHPLAVEAGLEILDAGGTAADAAIAALLVLNVVEPQSSGIGGGAFAVIAKGDEVTTLDGRETAPKGATPDMFLEDGEPLPFLKAVVSGNSVGVPGLVRMLAALHEQHGALEWEDLFAPAIHLADQGFTVTPRLAESVAASASRLKDSNAALVFMPGGVPLAEGDVVRQPALARTLRMIARDGPDGFYKGLLPEEIVHSVTLEPQPGTITIEDLADYRVVERPAICHGFAEYRICGMGPPSSGATTIGQILMMLDDFADEELSLDGAPLWHLFAEASRLAYADRARYLADPEFVDVPTAGLLDPEYVASRAEMIPVAEASTERAEAGDPPQQESEPHAPDGTDGRPGTTQLSVVDAEGLAISVTASIETAFGSGRMAGGFLLNNQMTDFSFLPEAEDGTPIANSIAPGKRPRSSMAPTIVFDDDGPIIVTGSPGGARIPEYVAQNLLAMLLFDLDPAEAAALPHVSERNSGVVSLEPSIAPEIAKALVEMGHEVEEVEMTSGVHTIRIRRDGTLEGGADPRREGVALGR